MNLQGTSEVTYPFLTKRRFNSYSGFFRKEFGGRLQKVSIDAGFTCPNRDGSKGYGGCTFCRNDAFNPSYCSPSKSITTQISEGIKFLSRRYHNPKGYLAYFQAYSNTYAPVDVLRKIYGEALSFPGVKGIIIGTRPDCIDKEKIAFLKSLTDEYYVAVEYGAESCYDTTLKRINRGHSFNDTISAIEMTASAGIHTGAHFIFGLPGETRTEMLNEAAVISELPLNTVKFHQLQIIKGTVMEKLYYEHPEEFNLFSFEDYVDFFIEFLERLSPRLVVERFTGEAPPGMLAIRNWSSKRSDQIISIIEKRMEELNTWQGRLYKKKKIKISRSDMS